jgi:hypothetical protein
MSQRGKIPEWAWWVLYLIPLPCFLLPPCWLILTAFVAALAALVYSRGSPHLRPDKRCLTNDPLWNTAGAFTGVV